MKDKILIVMMGMLTATCNNASKETESAVDSTAKEQTVAPSQPVANDYADSVNMGLLSTDTLKGSPHRVAMAIVDSNHVHIEYNSPGVRGRTIWGALVPYDKIWVTGAHMATSVQFEKDVLIGDKKVPAGKYALFTIPGKDNWTIVLNKQYEQHQADKYKQNEDVARVSVKPQEHEMTQRLTYEVKDGEGKSAEIQVRWEKVQVSLPFTTI
jgi:hypothetical protein